MADDAEERIEMVEEAQEKLAEAIELIEKAVAGLDCESNVEAYLISHLKCFLNAEHGYMDKSLNLDKLKTKITRELDPENEEEDDN